ncbi:MAG: ATP synthase F1 subunit delta [Deltaproteobacteria bacterium]|nr:ATP synthase F1 subunit delta [Deltaproteobacteria bacterium]
MKSSAARRFAKALVEIAREEKALDNYGKELRTTLALFKGNPNLYKVLLNPMHKIEERAALITGIAESLKLSPFVARFLNILVVTRNIKLLELIAESYSRFEDDISGRLRANVEAPNDLEPALLEDIKKKIGSAAGKEVIISFRNNPALIGGLVIRIDNTILDGSLKTQLELMKEKILEGVV